jgi:hypothetical protein
VKQRAIKTSSRRQPLVTNIPGSFTWVLLFLFAMAGVVAVPAGRPPVSAISKSSHLPASVETRITTEGFDSHHKLLPFTVYVLTEQLSWKLESADDLEGRQTILSPELILAVHAAREVFCVGTASSEGGTQTEERRADQRAAKLAHWVGGITGKAGHPRLFTLNAGQYKGPSELLSSYQRKAIILVTGPHEANVNLSEGLASGLERQQQTSPVIYGLLHHYSRSKVWLELPAVPH